MWISCISKDTRIKLEIPYRQKNLTFLWHSEEYVVRNNLFIDILYVKIRVKYIKILVNVIGLKQPIYPVCFPEYSEAYSHLSVADHESQQY